MRTSGDDERSLVERAKGGDAAAFASLLRSHDSNMRSFAYRLMGSGDAMDDVLQDAYLKAYRSLGSYQHQGRFGSWMFSVVHSCAMDSHRRTARRPQVSLEAMTERGVPAPTTAVDHASDVVDRDQLSAALASLPTDQAAAVALVDGEGLSYDEVAEVLGINPGTVASRLSRGRAAMRHQLNLDGRAAR